MGSVAYNPPGSARTISGIYISGIKNLPIGGWTMPPNNHLLGEPETPIDKYTLPKLNTSPLKSHQKGRLNSLPINSKHHFSGAMFNRGRSFSFGEKSLLFYDVPSSKLTWQWKITIFNRRYIFKGSIVPFYVSLPECRL